MAENKFLDDIAKFGNTTLSAMGSMQKQVRKWAGEQVDTVIENMDLVTRQQLDAYKRRIEELEERLASLETGRPKKPKAKTAAKSKTKDA